MKFDLKLLACICLLVSKCVTCQGFRTHGCIWLGYTLEILLALGFCSSILTEKNYLILIVYMAEYMLEIGEGDNSPSEHFKQIWDCVSGFICFG